MSDKEKTRQEDRSSRFSFEQGTTWAWRDGKLISWPPDFEPQDCPMSPTQAAAAGISWEQMVVEARKRRLESSS